MSYLEDIAQMRAARQGRELADQLENMKRDHAQNLELREQAYGAGDQESWDYYDREAERIEQEYARVCPPQQPQIPPAVAEFVQEYAPFFDKYGQQAWAALDTAVGYATRPIVQGSRNLANTGMGISPDSPDFKEQLINLFELYSKDLGLQFSRDERVLTPNEAAEISGVTPREYNKEMRRVYEGGYDAFSRQGQR